MKLIPIILSLFLIAGLRPSVCEAADSPRNKELYEAVLFQDVPKIKALLGQGADPNYRENDRALLAWAAQNGNLEVVKLLVDAKADVNSVDGIGHTPLIRAIETQQIEIVTYLLEKKADPNAKDREGQPVLVFAVKSRKPEIAKAVIDAGADVKYVAPDGNSPALEVAQEGLPESALMIKVLADAKANLDASNAAYTPLYYAVDQGYKEIVQALLDGGANPNGKTESGSLPIHEAVERVDILEMLLNKKADPNSVNGSGATPLIVAIENGYADAVPMLIKAGADVNKADNYGNTPLSTATQYSKTEIVDVLKKNGANG